MFEYKNIEIKKGVHNTFSLKSNVTLFFDPFRLDKTSEIVEPADIILITHLHYDHFSPKDIRKLIKRNTLLVVGGRIPDNPPFPRIRVKTVIPHDIFSEQGVVIQAIHAYNTNKYNSDGALYHKKEDNHVGYIVQMGRIKIYFAGDTDRIPEMAKLSDIDIAFLPISGVYVMTPEEAADVVRAIKPRISIPMHYGEVVGSVDDANRFKKICKKAGYQTLVKVL